MPQDPKIADILSRLPRLPKVVITSGMPYINGDLHLGHLAGAFVPADIYARWWRTVIGAQNVLYVSGTDDHGVTAQGAAQKKGYSPEQLVQTVHAAHRRTLKSYDISLNTYASTSDPKHLPDHTAQCHYFIEALKIMGQLRLESSQLYYDREKKCFLPDRWVRGTCPSCGYEDAYSHDCERCGAYYEPSELKNPRSTLSSTTPLLRSTRHLLWDFSEFAQPLWELFEGSRRDLPGVVFKQLTAEVAPRLEISSSSDQAWKERAGEVRKLLPRHKLFPSRRGGGGGVLQFAQFGDRDKAATILKSEGIDSTVVQSWSRRTLSRDTPWGVKLPEWLEFTEEERSQKSFYVWPDSLIAPLSFSVRALTERATEDAAKSKVAGSKSPSTSRSELPATCSGEYHEYWCDEAAGRFQFIGVDNLYFYGVMQSALCLADAEARRSSSEFRGVCPGPWQMSRLHTRFHLQVKGEKMSKSRGNFYTADELLEKGYTSDQIRYFLATLSLREKPSNWDDATFTRRNEFLAGPMNAALEKPFSAVHRHFNGEIPQGQILDKAYRATEKVMEQYVKLMPHTQYPQFLGAVENYARIINSIFNTHKPHDDRFPLPDRLDGLYTSFYILKNLLIWLYPFAPCVMERLRGALALPLSVYSIDELGVALPAGHRVGPVCEFFPPAFPHENSELENG